MLLTIYLLCAVPLYSNNISCTTTCEPLTSQTQAVRLHGLTTYIPRSQGDNSARELVGWQRQIYQGLDSNYATLASTIEYTRSFDTDCLARKLFNRRHLTFAGSQSIDRPANSLVADYFGLPTDFLGTLTFSPRIENIIIDTQLFFGLTCWLGGLYLKAHLPLVRTTWSLGIDDCDQCADKFRGCTQFPGCYMYSGPNTPNQDTDCPTPELAARVSPTCPVNPYVNPPRQFRNTVCTTQSIRTALSGNFTFGDMVEPWSSGKFSFTEKSKTGLADIDLLLGLNPIENRYAHAGIYVATTVPTGNRPKGQYIFEPLVGDGKHWKFGAGFSTHFSIFPIEDDAYFNMGVYLDGRLMHVFKTDQVRSFDFKRAEGEPSQLLTRYMLLKEFNTAREYAGTLINAINFTTRNCEVSVGLLTDVSAKFFITTCGWGFDLGYNYYSRDREKICIKTDCPCPLDSRIFGFKGLEGVCATTFNVVNGIVQANTATTIPLSTTQDTATMFDPQLPATAPTLVNGTTTLTWNSLQINNNVAFSGLVLPDFVGVTPGAVQFVTCADLDPSSAAQGHMKTHKIFAHINYTFDSCYRPHFGIGAEGEFDGNNDNALQQWGIWIKGGLTF